MGNDVDSDAGLVKIETMLGIAPRGEELARINAIVVEVARKVSAWERMTPKQLLQDTRIIDAIFFPCERAEMYAYVNDGQLPGNWRGALLHFIGPKLWKRFTAQMVRDTNARIARQAGMNERRMGGLARAANDPKQHAKTAAFGLWEERYAGKHPQLRTNEQFATKCMQEWPELTSAKVILGWCTSWNKQAKARSQPTS
jgi:hypothetical protein